MHIIDEEILSDTLAVHQQHGRDNACGHYHNLLAETMHNVVAEVLYELLSLLAAFVGVEIRRDAFLNIVMKHYWLAELNVDATVVYF